MELIRGNTKGYMKARKHACFHVFTPHSAHFAPQWKHVYPTLMLLSLSLQEFAGNHLPFVGFTFSKGKRLLDDTERGKGSEDVRLTVTLDTIDMHVVTSPTY